MAHFNYLVFAKVVERGTFYQAAKELKVTPSAVSHSINQLEQNLGFPLLRRNRSGVELTQDGAAILPYVQEILNLEHNLEQEANNIRGLNSGVVRIGAFSSICINWLPEIIRNFKSRYPKIKVTIVQGTFNEIAEKARIGAIDLGFTALPVTQNLKVIPLINDPIYCITPKDFEPKNRKSITQADISGKNFILQQIDYDRDTKKVLDDYQVTQNSLTFSIDDQSILAMVESNLGLGVLPKLALNKIKGDVNVFDFDRKYERHIALVANKTQMLAPAPKKMMKLMQEYLTKRYGDELLWK
ncbi:LysR family transcriptional regulator [Lactobacillus corticis]|uniref:LysR family transcriptional regulator n=1 Tax=Lactobacillus corticis TaxID=2201249 RepID=A0A916QJE4_9LACO|nr:LysR family transcriptional regulator [Lactobacillus corticis]GFZ26688.1 LysR family transcriptional regulator [Lactobacillus corticis]